ncbi:MAG TPA: terminase family protein, partial [Gaiellaceae bacterium]|nr:terminase family protein [Gaiellaceae bacterium]
AVMLEAVIDCQLADAEKKPAPWFCFSAAEVQTREMIRYAGIHARAIGLASEITNEEHFVRDERGDGKVTMLAINFEHGSRIVGLPTNIFSIRGKHGNLIGDEAGHWPNAEELSGAAMPIASREGRKIRLVGTPNERRGPFYEIMSGAREGWSLHRVDVHQAIREGCPIRLEDVYAAIGRGRKFNTEYGLIFEDAESRLIPIEAIVPCEDEGVLVVPFLRIGGAREWRRFVDADPLELAPSEGYDHVNAWKRLFAPLKGKTLYAGYDVARRRDLAVLSIIEPDGPLRRVRARIAFERRRFAEQRAALWAALEHCRRACIDATGIGAQLAEETVEKFGEARVEAIDFGSAVKEDMATRVLRQFEDRSIRVPSEPELRESIHSIYKITTAAGKTRYDADATEETGHADDFWALGLALLAAGDGAHETWMASAGKRAWTREFTDWRGDGAGGARRYL